MGLNLQTVPSSEAEFLLSEKCINFVISGSIWTRFSTFNSSKYSLELRCGSVPKKYILEIQELVKNYMLEEEIIGHWGNIGCF